MKVREPQINDKIRNCKLLELVGEGGFSKVFRCKDDDGNEYAIKITPLASKLGSEAPLQEATNLKKLKQANCHHILEYIDSFEENGYFYLVTEIIQGETLKQRLKRNTFKPAQCWNLLHTLLKTVGIIHRCGIVHLDLKPDNILLRADGSIVIADFGSSQLINSLSKNNHVTYSETYGAPEQVYGGELSNKTDIWSIGAILFHAYVGRRPIRTTTETAVQHEDDQLGRAIDKALSPDANNRYATVGKFISDIGTIEEIEEKQQESLKSRSPSSHQLTSEDENSTGSNYSDRINKDSNYKEPTNYIHDTNNNSSYKENEDKTNIRHTPWWKEWTTPAIKLSLVAILLSAANLMFSINREPTINEICFSENPNETKAYQERLMSLMKQLTDTSNGNRLSEAISLYNNMNKADCLAPLENREAASDLIGNATIRQSLKELKQGKFKLALGRFKDTKNIKDFSDEMNLKLGSTKQMIEQIRANIETQKLVQDTIMEGRQNTGKDISEFTKKQQTQSTEKE